MLNLSFNQTYGRVFDRPVTPGQWTLGLDVFVTDYDKVAMSGPVEIR
jgi:hypothetical protein